MIIDAIQNGIVIDHITAGKTMELYSILGLGELDCTVAILKNVTSRKLGRKDIIKIDREMELDWDLIGYVDPSITVYIIRGGELKEKRKLNLPERIRGVLKCKNPRCITSVEQELPQEFILTDREKRVALFALISDSDTSFNFLVSVLYQQLFQQLFDSADHKHGGSLPVPVHFLMDEFANISLPEDFDKKLSTMRSRNVFVSIILQNIAQLKALFEKQWESILGNCDELLYLGGNEQGSHKYISELLGKATIDTNTYGRSSGRNGNYSTNYQITGRELMTPDEVRMLDNGKALLFIRGELPVCDDKFDIMTHPLVSHTPDGGAPPYIHGSAEYAIAAITIHDRLLPTDPVAVPSENETQYELLSNEELEAIYELEEKPNEASQKH